MPLYDENNIPSLDVRINGPFNDQSNREMLKLLDTFLRATGLHDYREYFAKGMYLAQNHTAFDHPRSDGLTLTKKERKILKYEDVPVKVPDSRGSRRTWSIDFKKWKNVPAPLWRLVSLCALGAAVQGWDEAAVNGAQSFYRQALKIDIEQRPPIILGLVNSAPYLACVVSCWLTPWLNRHYGRRGTIFLTAIMSAAFAFAQAFANTWEILLSFAFSWVLVGIMLGATSGVVFQDVGASCDDSLSLRCSWNWRLILASPMVAPIILALYIYTQSESPRWLVNEGHRLRMAGLPKLAQARYEQAWEALTKLRHERVQAAKDMFEIYHLLESEREEINRTRDVPGRGWLRTGVFELFAVRRNRRATVASLVCMFAQQFCGVNVIVYYSNLYLSTVQHNHRSALFFTMGFSIINFVFGIPAFYTIDSIGRRSLLLITFPFLAIFQFMTASSFAGNKWRLALAGTYLFGIAYSPGEGPVPFVYAAESMPLYIRDQGMGLVVSINWLFNWLIAFTLPKFFDAFTQAGAFYYYSAWCVVLWFMIFFLVPETRNLSLEQLDLVFRHHSSTEFASKAVEKALYNIRVILARTPILRRFNTPEKDLKIPDPLYAPPEGTRRDPEQGVEMQPTSSRTLSVEEEGQRAASTGRSRSGRRVFSNGRSSSGNPGSSNGRRLPGQRQDSNGRSSSGDPGPSNGRSRSATQRFGHERSDSSNRRTSGDSIRPVRERDDDIH